MKLEYIADGSNYAPFIRLYDFTAVEATRLKVGIERLANGEWMEADLQSFVPAESIGNCHLIFMTAQTSSGIEPLDQGTTFACRMNLSGWADMVDFIEPFCRNIHAPAQWLTGYESYVEIPLLLSSDGRW